MGETYTSHFSVFEGDVASEKMCAACAALRGEFAAAHESMTVMPSAFQDILVECIADGDEDSERKWKPMLQAIKRRHVA